jgi:hypothetical protein
MTLDLGAVAARFKRAGQPIPLPEPPAPAERPWLTAEAHLPPEGPSVLEARKADRGQTLPPRRASGQGPKRRRWAMPGSPGERRQPVPMGGGGAAAAYGRPLIADPYTGRPEPIGRQDADTTSLVRDDFNPWRAHPAQLLPTGPVTLRERVLGWWAGPDQEPNNGR